MSSLQKALLLWPLLVAGCVPTPRDLASIGNDELVLVGHVELTLHARDYSRVATFEVSGARAGYQLDERGDALWVVPRPKEGQPLRLAWISTLDDTISYGEAGPELVSATDTAKRCVYMGDLKIHVVASARSEREQGATSIGRPELEVEVAHAKETLVRIEDRHPGLRELGCAAGTKTDASEPTQAAFARGRDDGLAALPPEGQEPPPFLRARR